MTIVTLKPWSCFWGPTLHLGRLGVTSWKVKWKFSETLQEMAEGCGRFSAKWMDRLYRAVFSQLTSVSGSQGSIVTLSGCLGVHKMFKSCVRFHTESLKVLNGLHPNLRFQLNIYTRLHFSVFKRLRSLQGPPYWSQNLGREKPHWLHFKIKETDAPKWSFTDQQCRLDVQAWCRHSPNLGNECLGIVLTSCKRNAQGDPLQKRNNKHVIDFVEWDWQWHIYKLWKLFIES